MGEVALVIFGDPDSGAKISGTDQNGIGYIELESDTDIIGVGIDELFIPIPVCILVEEQIIGDHDTKLRGDRIFYP